MADQADVYVKNKLTNDIHVARKLSNGSIDVEETISNGNTEQINLGSTDVSLLITPPGGTDIKDCYICVRPDVDLDVKCSRTDSKWTLKILPNSLPPEAPTTVNVTIGEDENP